MNRLRAIRIAGLKVGLVIHRHQIESSEVALQIEAALIDAYPGLTNEVSGHESGDYGCRHIEQIVAEYSVEPFHVTEPLMLISIGRTYEDGLSTYDAVRAAWRIKQERATRFKLVVAHCQGIVVGVFRPERWFLATKDKFPWIHQDFSDRYGFEGKTAEPETERLYLEKRVPDEFRRRGAANPVRFVPCLVTAGPST